MRNSFLRFPAVADIEEGTKTLGWRRKQKQQQKRCVCARGEGAGAREVTFSESRALEKLRSHSSVQAPTRSTYGFCFFLLYGTRQVATTDYSIEHSCMQRVAGFASCSSVSRKPEQGNACFLFPSLARPAVALAGLYVCYAAVAAL